MTHPELLSTIVIPITGGLAVGFLAGLITGFLAALRWVDRRRERGEPVPIYTDTTNPTPGRIPWRGSEHLSRLGWLLAALGIVGVLLGSYSLYRNQHTATCLAEFNAQFTDAQRERSDAADLDRQAIRQQRNVTREFNQVMIDAVTNPIPPTDTAAQAKARADFLAKARDWDARLAEVDRLDRAAEAQRQQNPLPQQPNC